MHKAASRAYRESRARLPLETMVVNTRRRFVFVHVPKSAGVSMMTALRVLDGNVDWRAKTRHETLGEFERRHPGRRCSGPLRPGR